MLSNLSVNPNDEAPTGSSPLSPTIPGCTNGTIANCIECNRTSNKCI